LFYAGAGLWSVLGVTRFETKEPLSYSRSIKITLFGREFGWGGTFNKL